MTEKNNKQMLIEIRSRLERIEKQNELLHDNEKKQVKKEKAIPKLIIFVTSLIIIIFIALYLYKNDNTIVAITGNPENISVTNFNGDFSTDTKLIMLDKGAIINRDNIIFRIGENEYSANPGELEIFFDCDKDIEKYGYKYGNSMMTSKDAMYYSTTISSDYRMISDVISFRKMSSTDDYLSNMIRRHTNEDPEEETLIVNFIAPQTDALLQIQKKEVIILSGGVIVKFKGKELSSTSVNLEINNDIGCSFILHDLSNLELMIRNDDGFSLNGNIESINGQFEIAGGKLICTDPTSQKEYTIGAQDIGVDGKNLNFVYNYNSDDYKMSVNGKTTKARIEKIEIKENIWQFLLTRSDDIILLILGAIITLYVGKISKI